MAEAVSPPLPRFVSYLWVSTESQGRSGLALEAQRQAPGCRRSHCGGRRPAAGGGLRPSSKRWRAASAPTGPSSRPHLRFLLSVVEGSGKAGMVFCDLPSVPAKPIGKSMVTQLAARSRCRVGGWARQSADARSAGGGEGARVRLGNPSPAPASPAMAIAVRAARRRQAAGVQRTCFPCRRFKPRARAASGRSREVCTPKACRPPAARSIGQRRKCAGYLAWLSPDLLGESFALVPFARGAGTSIASASRPPRPSPYGSFLFLADLFSNPM